MSAAPAGAYALQSSAGPDHDTIVVTGEIDLASAADFERALTLAGARRPAVLDLSAVSYFDSAAFAALQRALARHPLVVLLAPGSVIARAAELMQVPFLQDAGAAGEAARAKPA